MGEAARGGALVIGPTLAWPPGALVVLGAPVPGLRRVVSSAQLLLCGASCTTMIARTNKEVTCTNRTNTPRPHPNTHTGICRSTGRVHTHTHRIRIHTHTKTHTCAPQSASPSTTVHLPRARPSSWTVAQPHRLLCFPEPPLPLSPAGRGQAPGKGCCSRILEPRAALQG